MSSNACLLAIYIDGSLSKYDSKQAGLVVQACYARSWRPTLLDVHTLGLVADDFICHKATAKVPQREVATYLEARSWLKQKMANISVGRGSWLELKLGQMYFKTKKT